MIQAMRPACILILLSSVGCTNSEKIDYCINGYFDNIVLTSPVNGESILGTKENHIWLSPAVDLRSEIIEKAQESKLSYLYVPLKLSGKCHISKKDPNRIVLDDVGEISTVESKEVLIELHKNLGIMPAKL